MSSINLKRSSNLELYRIICMLFIIAHHYVVNSGLTAPDGPILENPSNINSVYLLIMGMYGKTGINCFLMITGYFMCKSTITLRKFLKLILEIYLYTFGIYFIFIILGQESFSIKSFIKILVPFWGIQQNFTGCYIIFWLTIPFWNILIQNLSKKRHELLIILTIGIYSLLGSVPTFHVTFNYVTWFGIIYLTASYIRLYPHPIFERKNVFGLTTMILITLSIISLYLLIKFIDVTYAYYFMIDCNKFFALTIAISAFLWFKNINVPYNKTINLIGASTFGIYLIHTRPSMRQWLWGDIFNCVENYNLPLTKLIIYSTGVVLLIFALCTIIDILRIKYLEEPLFKKLDIKYPKIKKILF